MSTNFSVTRAGITVAVATVAGLATKLNNDPLVAAAAPDALIDNRGSADAYILFGAADATVTADTGVRIPAGAIAVYSKGNATHIAAVGAGATSLVVHLGQGG